MSVGRAGDDVSATTGRRHGLAGWTQAFAAGLLVLAGTVALGAAAWLAAAWLSPAELQRPAARYPVDDDELVAVRAYEDALLSGYGWADREAGIATIPIEEAMRIVAERGWAGPPPPER